MQPRELVGMWPIYLLQVRQPRGLIQPLPSSVEQRSYWEADSRSRCQYRTFCVTRYITELSTASVRASCEAFEVNPRNHTLFVIIFQTAHPPFHRPSRWFFPPHFPNSVCTITWSVLRVVRNIMPVSTPQQSSRVSVALVAKPVLIRLHYETHNSHSKCLHGLTATEQMTHLIKPVV
jgi:hypothetical protein